MTAARQPRVAVPEMNLVDQGALEDAAMQLTDCVELARGEIDSITVAEQVEITLVALADARRVLLEWRRASCTPETRGHK